MTSRQTRDILERLADGELMPSEAEERLRALDEDDSEADDEPTTILREQKAPQKIRASVHGPGLLEIIGEDGAQDVRTAGPSKVSVNDENEDIEVHAELGDDAILIVPVDVDLIADLHGADASIRNIQGSLQAEVHAGSFRCEAALTRGESRIEAHVGDVDLTLDPSSDVRITVRAVADIHVSPRLKKIGRGEWQYGAGTSTLEIDGAMGSISISVA